MSFWFNNFAEFERKQNRENRLVLNFRYISDKNDTEKDKNVKAYVQKNVRIPSGFVHVDKVEGLIEKIMRNQDLNIPSVNRKKFGKFEVLDIEMPNHMSIIQELSGEFQTGNYDKFLRFGGFSPGRKVVFDEKVLEQFKDKQEVELQNLNGVEFNGFLTEEEFKTLPYLVIDIEKPLWKKRREKELIDLRERLLKQEKKYEKNNKGDLFESSKSIKRKRVIGKLEERLKVNIDDVESINLYDERFNADVSYVGTIWGNNGEVVKELYVIDPNDEILRAEENGFKIIKFKNEKELINGFIDKLKERKPVISYGHNQVYDTTQLKFAADNWKIMFDPAIKEIKPRRDFVRKFLQRLKEDLIYLDTLWISKIFYPYLNQGRFETSHKLEGVARFLGIDFKKSLTHEQLREIEAKRLAGKTLEVRKKAAEEMISYSCADLNVTKEIIDKINPFSLLLKMKDVLPFCTLSEIAFSTNCMNKLHEFKHFQKAGNMPYYEYKAKERQDEMQIFKKRFASEKKDNLRNAGLKKVSGGFYENVSEFYVPLEDWTKEVAFNLHPKLKEIYNSVRGSEKEYFAFLQYLKSFMKEIYADHYFVNRDKEVYNFTLDYLGLNERDAQEFFSEIRKNVDSDELNGLVGSFRFLKNHFRSIYAPLNGGSRQIIRPTQRNLSSITYPKIMEKDADLFLLRYNSESIRDNLSDYNKKTLAAFLNNFNKFDGIISYMGSSLYSLNNFNSTDGRSLLYSFIYNTRFTSSTNKFFTRYGIDADILSEKIVEGYKTFANEIKSNGLTFLDNIGDYVLVHGQGNLPSSIKIRDLKTFEVK